MKALAIFPKCDSASNFSSPYNGIIEAFEALGVPLHIILGMDVVGADLTKVRSSATERQIINLISEIKPDLVVTINNHGMTKRVRDAISVPVVKWLFDDVEHYFVHESFGDWLASFDPDDIVLCYSSELCEKVRAGCPYLRRPPTFLPHATAVDLFRAFPPTGRHNTSFIGSYLDVGPALHFMQHFGQSDPMAPLALEAIVAEIRRDPQLDIEAALEAHGLTEQVRAIGVRPGDLKRVLSDLISTRDRLEGVLSLKDLGVALFGRNDWLLPLIFAPGSERVFQYDGKLGTQVDLVKAYQSSKITVDIPNVQNRTAIGGRVIEAMASGSLLITKFQEGSDLYRVFGPDCPVPTYRDLAELHALAERYLRNEDERRELVARCNALVAHGFDYKDRVRHVLGLAGLAAPAVPHRVAAKLIRELEPPQPQQIGTDLDRFERTVRECVRNGQFDEALNLLIVYVQASWQDPATLTKLFGSARLDELCLLIGRHAVPAAADRPSTETSVYVASHLAGHGGHTHVLESAVLADATARRVVLLTDLFNHADVETLRARFEKICEFRAAPHGCSLMERLRWLSDQLAELTPKNILLLNHHEDSVMIAAMAPWLAKASVFFIHHADTNLCLGVHLPGATHIDLHNIGFNCCREQEEITDNVYLPLSISEKPPQSPDRAFRVDGRLLTCSSGSYNKFSARYAYEYVDLITLRLQADRGRHIHIGGIPPSELARIRSVLEAADVDPERFVHVPWVESVWSTFVERKVDLYISSFPLSGGLASIEAMGSGTPILAHKSDMSRFHGGGDLMYPDVLTWRNASEFETIIETVTAERLSQDSRAGLAWFRRHHSFRAMGEQLNRILLGRGQEVQPPPLQEHRIDRLEQYRHFASLGGGQQIGSVLADMEGQKERALAVQARVSDELRKQVKALIRELESISPAWAARPGATPPPEAEAPPIRAAEAVPAVAPLPLTGISGDLRPGSALTVGALLTSSDGRWCFGLADDGRLVLRATSGDEAPLWESAPMAGAARLEMQPDGNLVLYDHQGAPRWASDTAGFDGAHLSLRDDGTLVLTLGLSDVWTRPEVPEGAAPAMAAPLAAEPGPRLAPGAVMRMGERLMAPAGGCGLYLQGDGNLVLYRLEGDQPSEPIWASGTAGSEMELHMGRDGALVLWTLDGGQVWRADALRHPGAQLEVTNDGALRLTIDGRELWRAPELPRAWLEDADAGRDERTPSLVDG